MCGGCRPRKYLTDMHPSNIWECRPPKYLTDIHPSNILGVWTPPKFHGTTFVKYFGGVDPPKYLTDIHSSNVWGV